MRKLITMATVLFVALSSAFIMKACETTESNNSVDKSDDPPAVENLENEEVVEIQQPDVIEDSVGCDWDTERNVCVHHVCSTYCSGAGTSLFVYRTLDNVNSTYLEDQKNFDKFMRATASLIMNTVQYFDVVLDSERDPYLQAQEEVSRENDSFSVITQFYNASWDDRIRMGEVDTCSEVKEASHDFYNEYSDLIDSFNEESDVKELILGFRDHLEGMESLCTKHVDTEWSSVQIETGSHRINGDRFSSRL